MLDAVGNNGSPAIVLKILNGFELQVGGRHVRIPFYAEKLLAFLAVRKGCLLRSRIAGELWPEATAERAAANLRGAVWRLRDPARDALDVSSGRLGLASGVAVDFYAVTAAANRLLDTSAALTEENLATLMRVDFEAELLPDWLDDEWLALEREHFSQLRLDALESLSGHLVAAGRYGAAARAAMAAIRIDPLRESAHRALITVHIAHGNYAPAFQQYHRFRRTLLNDLGIEPSPQLIRSLHVAAKRASSA